MNQPYIFNYHRLSVLQNFRGARSVRSMVRLVLFDIDGTLIHSGGAGVGAFARAFAEEFSIPSGTEKMRFCGRTDISLVREFFGMNGIEPSPGNFERFFRTYTRLLGQLLKESRGHICPGVLEFISDLEALPEPPAIGLLTGNIRLGAEIKLGHYGLWDRFSFGGFADDSEDRDQIAVAAKKRGSQRANRELRGEEIVVVGDTHLDIRCARAIEAKALAVGTGNFSADELAKHNPDWAVDDLGKISAEEVCVSPARLKQA
jgi:phosphoglycolate phosphatase-like HAD superfamily hydrolase